MSIRLPGLVLLATSFALVPMAAQAAQVLGYANRSHLAIAFRKKFGMNPSAYRKHQQYFGQTRQKIPAVYNPNH
ncbi:hypothetical protein GS597_19465 [Synechococcales cyanobacterium C]|uniref:HTH araC/xylS-type domain-containing protein n=1 Tax=Petrachloros mirabilis ULC683 TaxID=2781853 RepID=A0A8K2AA11_9CYAN|nr:AraC family transcriptional regulator [Petrachloros mirabilis]NCJ08645.1 hypothetical protein [Petrachloros mirabilis ULC683]